jgi:hypothetical protein
MPITHWVYKFPPMICISVIILLMLWTKRDCYIVCLLLSSKTENISLKNTFFSVKYYNILQSYNQRDKSTLLIYGTRLINKGMLQGVYNHLFI